jgi:hypothetical protein
VGIYLDVATVIAVLNVALLLGLLAVWVRNYRTFGTSLVLGMIAFATVLLLQNLVAIYFFAFSMKMLFAMDATVQFAVMVLRALELVALAVLSLVTYR